jgi:hypothetical protein
VGAHEPPAGQRRLAARTLGDNMIGREEAPALTGYARWRDEAIWKLKDMTVIRFGWLAALLTVALVVGLIAYHAGYHAGAHAVEQCIRNIATLEQQPSCPGG